MKSMASIHNDDVKCFHVAVQKTHKLVVMGHINLEDHALIKRWRACKKLNVTSETFKDEKNRVTIKSNLRFLLEVVHVFKVLSSHQHEYRECH
jgi:hypothetical protein